jgi:RNA polymerase sigma-70 factor (ECF subfamily)
LKAPKKEAKERLLIEAAQKDPRRFTELYEEQFERVYAYVARRLNRREDAQDVTSEVFHQALANLRQFEWRGVPFAAWLHRIAANAIADHWQREQQRTGQRAAHERENPGSEPEAEPNAQDLAEIEECARLFRLVKTLPAEQRRVVEMRFAEEKSIREIAKALRRSEGAIKQLQFRGVEKLRAAWAKKPVKQSGKANG